MVEAYAASKKLLWEACERNNWCVPSPKSRMGTYEFYDEVSSNITYAFNNSAIVVMSCFSPPTNSVLQLMMVQNCRLALESNSVPNNLHAKFKRLIEHAEVRTADTAYYLKVLATLHKMGIECEIFAKDYVPPKVRV